MYDISLVRLLYLLFPLFCVAYFYNKWVDNSNELVYASVRMLVQLIAIGYVLTALFSQRHWWVGILVAVFMLVVSSFISLRNTSNKNWLHYLIVFTATAVAAIVNLWLILVLVLNIGGSYDPRVLIPLSGMAFHSIMNVLSLAIERFETEYDKNQSFGCARKYAFKAAMIPQINALFAVGLVSLPGMMTGQILSGIDPLIAVRYQIVIMMLGVSGGGGSVIIYFLLRDKILGRGV